MTTSFQNSRGGIESREAVLRAAQGRTGLSLRLNAGQGETEEKTSIGGRQSKTLETQRDRQAAFDPKIVASAGTR